MVFAPDVNEALSAAAALANSAGEPDTLTSVGDLAAFYDSWRYTGRRPRTRAELDDLRGVRARLRSLLIADRDEAVALVNAILAEFHALPQLVRHDDRDWHLHAVDDEALFHERVLVETAMAVADVIRAGENERLQVCAASECDGVVVDLSRNRSRKFCSTTCGNREAQAAHRARQG